MRLEDFKLYAQLHDIYCRQESHLELTNAAIFTEDDHVVDTTLAALTQVNVLVDTERVHTYEGSLNW